MSSDAAAVAVAVSPADAEGGAPTEKFIEACQEARALLVQTTESELPKRHALGVIAKRMKTLSATYGKHAVERLAKELGQDKSTLYKAIKVVDVFNDDDVAKIVDRNRRDDVRPFSWNHFVLCASVPGEAHTLRDRALEHGWSITELKGEVARVTARPGATTASTVMRDLRRLSKLLERIVNVANDAVTKPPRSVPDDDQPRVAELITTAIEEVEAVPALLRRIGQRFAPTQFQANTKGLAKTKRAGAPHGSARRDRLTRAKSKRAGARPT